MEIKIKLDNPNYKPTLYEIHQVLHQEIVGEHESRMSLFTNWVLGHQNVMITGARASGKTFITDHIRKYFLKDKCYAIEMGSDKSGWYQTTNIEKADYILIYELNQLPKDFHEVLKMWGEGKEATYKVVSMEGGFKRVITKKLPPRPFAFCLADEDETRINEQMNSRLTTIRTDDTINQNKAVMFDQANLAALKKNYKEIDHQKIQNLKLHLDSLPSFEKNEFKNPAASLFVEAIPPFFTDCRRDFPKYLANCMGICRYHHKERSKIKTKFGHAYFITPEDMLLNQIIYGNTLIQSSLKCTNLQRKMIIILNEYRGLMDRNKMQRHLRQHGLNISAHMITRHLTDLTNIGYCESEKESSSSPVKYRSASFVEDFKLDIDWKKVIELSFKIVEQEYPEALEAYKKSCKKEITHPFTGEMINMENYDEIKKISAVDNSLNQYKDQNKDRYSDPLTTNIKGKKQSILAVEEEVI